LPPALAGGKDNGSQSTGFSPKKYNSIKADWAEAHQYPDPSHPLAKANGN
jgi:hypothetical protein